MPKLFILRQKWDGNEMKTEGQQMVMLPVHNESYSVLKYPQVNVLCTHPVLSRGNDWENDGVKTLQIKQGDKWTENIDWEYNELMNKSIEKR